MRACEPARFRCAGASAAWTNLQYYFDVNNTYVMNKIIVRSSAENRIGGARAPR